jgi:hypothetical protein
VFVRAMRACVGACVGAVRECNARVVIMRACVRAVRACGACVRACVHVCMCVCACARACVRAGELFSFFFPNHLEFINKHNK